jgi:hypothetical protein
MQRLSIVEIGISPQYLSTFGNLLAFTYVLCDVTGKDSLFNHSSLYRTWLLLRQLKRMN